MAHRIPRPDRRSFLRASGISIGLPLFESLRRQASATAPAAAGPPKRMVCIGNSFGMYPSEFFPSEAGGDYQMPSLLQPLEPHRSDLTLFSHLDHGIKGGHFAVHTFLTGVHHAEGHAMHDGGISVDQRAAEHVGAATRFPSLAVGCESGLHGGCQMSWTRTGVRVPPIPGPRELFRKLFLQDSVDSKARALDRFHLQGSILDAVGGDANSLDRRLSKRDRDKLAEYLQSVRDVERRLQLDRHWQQFPKPQPPIPEPTNDGIVSDLPHLYDLIALALQTDSTRVATLEVSSDGFRTSDLGVNGGYHSLSHHGQEPEKIAQLVKLERYQTEQFARFLEKLKSIRDPESDGSLIDSTIVLFGSGMGNGNAHTNTDLPIVLAGGGFRHGAHRVMPAETNKRVPLCNLFLSMLQQFGLETDSFSMSTGTLTGLEVA